MIAPSRMSSVVAGLSSSYSSEVGHASVARCCGGGGMVLPPRTCGAVVGCRRLCQVDCLQWLHVGSQGLALWTGGSCRTICVYKSCRLVMRKKWVVIIPQPSQAERLLIESCKGGLGWERRLQAIHHANRTIELRGCALLQAINNVRYVRSFNALKVKEVAVACSAVGVLCVVGFVLEILANHGGQPDAQLAIRAEMGCVYV